MKKFSALRLIKTLLLSILFIINSKSYCQTIEKFYDYNWKECNACSARFYSVIIHADSGYVRNDYYIREKKLQMAGKYEDSVSKIPNGHFQYYYANGNLKSIGNYIHGKKEGLWLEYHNNNMMNDSSYYLNGQKTGTSKSWHENGYPKDSAIFNVDGSGISVSWFDNGYPSSGGRYSKNRKPDGKWKYFHNNGKLSSEETYREGNLMSKQYYDEDGNPIQDMTNHDRRASFPGGSGALEKYLKKRIHFPDKYTITYCDTAIVRIGFTVDEKGNVGNVYTDMPFYPEFDWIAENAVKKFPKWMPGVDHNRNVRYSVFLPVRFVLVKN